MENTQNSVAPLIAAYFFFLLGTQIALQTTYFISIRTLPAPTAPTPSIAAVETPLIFAPNLTAALEEVEALPTDLTYLLGEEPVPEIIIEHRDLTGLKREVLSKRRRDQRRAERAARPRPVFASQVPEGNHLPEGDLDAAELAALAPVTYQEIFDSLSAAGIRGTVIEEAKKYLGLRYRWGGTTPKGFDCSGFTSYVLAQKGVGIARSSRLQAKQGKAIDLKNAQTGDLIFFSRRGKGGRVNHVALVVDNKEDGVYIIHSTRRGIVVDNLSTSKYWQPKVLYAKDVISKG